MISLTKFDPKSILDTLLDILGEWNINDIHGLAYKIRSSNIQYLYQPYPVVSCLYALSMCLKNLPIEELQFQLENSHLITRIVGVLQSSEPSVRKAGYECLVECSLILSDSFLSVTKRYLSGSQEKMISIMAEKKQSK